MNLRFTLTIKKRSQPEWLIWLIVVLPFFFGTLNNLLGLPYAIRYILDIVWIMLLIFMYINKRLHNMKAEIALIITFFGYTLLVYIIQFQSPLYYLWGFRNNFRFFVAFFAFASFLKVRDFKYYWKFFDIAFWMNAIVTVIQYLFLELEGDSLGGIFGVEEGANAYTNIFFLIIITKSIIFYLENKESTLSCALKCGVALLVSALAELKFFFVEFILILVLAVLFTRFSWKKIGLIFWGALAVIIGASFLTILFPNFEGWFSVKWFLENAISDMGYTASGDLNRLGAIPRINTLWLDGLGEQLFGLGLGNCDTSNFSFLNTPFFEAYGHMHYSWISYAFMYLECGWIGLLFYWGFFVLLFFRIRKIENRSAGTALSYCRIGKILAICCVIITIYNSSLRVEPGYPMYFVLAMPFALDRCSSYYNF